MSFIGLEPIARDERVQYALFLLAVAVLLWTESLSMWQNLLLPLCVKIAATFRELKSIVNDYQFGKYYKPWKPTSPTVIVSTKKQIAELSEATCLSQRAVYADMFGFKHTMNKFEHNTSDHKVIRTRLYSRLLQINGPAHLNVLYPLLLVRMDSSLKRELHSGRATKDGISLPIAKAARNLTSDLMSLMFFGDALSSDKKFSHALLQYPRDMVKCMAAFQITPSPISPYVYTRLFLVRPVFQGTEEPTNADGTSLVHAILTKRGKAMHLIQNRLFHCMGPGRSAWKEPEHTKRLTIMHNMAELTDASDYWNPELLSQSLLGIWFAASHQPWMNLHFILLELCIRREWQSTLRQELEQNAPMKYQQLERLPLLDSFIKETVRLNPLDTLAIRRKALEAYTFSDGFPSVPAGATVCVSAYDLMHNPQTYHEPNSFEATRFVPQNPTDQQRRFSEVSETFPVWGYGSLACPGRFHASLAIKMILSQLLLRYEIRLEDEKARTRWSWETFTMPYESTRVVLKERSA